jgi:hypothetical protein
VVSDAENRSAEEGSGGGGGNIWFPEESNPIKSSKGPGGSIENDSSGDARDMSDDNDNDEGDDENENKDKDDEESS